MKAYFLLKKKRSNRSSIYCRMIEVCGVCVVIHMREPAHTVMYEHAEA